MPAAAKAPACLKNSRLVVFMKGNLGLKFDKNKEYNRMQRQALTKIYNLQGFNKNFLYQSQLLLLFLYL